MPERTKFSYTFDNIAGAIDRFLSKRPLSLSRGPYMSASKQRRSALITPRCICAGVTGPTAALVSGIECLGFVGHAADAYHRIDIRQSSRHLVVKLDDRAIADTTRPVVLFESGFAPLQHFARIQASVDSVRRT
jgi:hypothetical protein